MKHSTEGLEGKASKVKPHGPRLTQCFCLTSNYRIMCEMGTQELPYWVGRCGLKLSRTVQLPSDRNLTQSGFQPKKNCLAYTTKKLWVEGGMALQAWLSPDAPVMLWEIWHLALLPSRLVSYSGRLSLYVGCWQPHGSVGTTERFFWEKFRISSHWTNSGYVPILEWITLGRMMEYANWLCLGSLPTLD